jgi:hypothetical protein
MVPFYSVFQRPREWGDHLILRPGPACHPAVIRQNGLWSPTRDPRSAIHAERLFRNSGLEIFCHEEDIRPELRRPVHRRLQC